MYDAGVRVRKYSVNAGQALIQAFQRAKDILLLRKQRYFVEEYEKNQIQVHRSQSKQVVGRESPTYIIEKICVSGLMIIVCSRVIIWS